MPNYKSIVSYIGTNYCGWQRQKNSITVQEIIEDALTILLKENIQITGSGRTDSGVHALNQVFNFHCSYQPDLRKLLKSLNSILPDDIVIKDIHYVTDDFNARYSAISRTYKYIIIEGKNIFYKNISWQIYFQLDLDKLNNAANLFIGEYNFSAFCKNINEIKNTKCTVFASRWRLLDNKYIYTIEANRFLHGMVRGIVGSMVDYSNNKISLEHIINCLNDPKNYRNKFWVSSEGLFLNNVKYGV